MAVKLNYWQCQSSHYVCVSSLLAFEGPVSLAMEIHAIEKTHVFRYVSFPENNNVILFLIMGRTFVSGLIRYIFSGGDSWFGANLRLDLWFVRTVQFYVFF